jgi:hypothetical protein
VKLGRTVNGRAVRGLSNNEAVIAIEDEGWHVLRTTVLRDRRGGDSGKEGGDRESNSELHCESVLVAGCCGEVS